MTSVNEIQKINSIAKELLEHGMVTNRHDAVIMARKMLKSDESGEMFEQAQRSVPFKEKSFTPMASGYAQPQQESQPQEQPMNSSQNNSQIDPQNQYSGDNISFNELASVIKKNTDFLVKKIVEFQKDLETVKGEVGHYRKEFIDLKSSILFSRRQAEPENTHSSSNMHSSSEIEHEEESEVSDKGSKAEFVQGSRFELKGGKANKENNQKKGDYKPSDVALDKIFYYGTR